MYGPGTCECDHSWKCFTAWDCIKLGIGGVTDGWGSVRTSVLDHCVEINVEQTFLPI